MIANFADMDVLAIGPVADAVTASFDAFWNSPAAFPIAAFHAEAASPEQVAAARKKLNVQVADTGAKYYAGMEATPLSLELRAQELEFFWGTITVLHDMPDKVADESESEVLLSQLGGVVGQAREDLLIVSP